MTCPVASTPITRSQKQKQKAKQANYSESKIEYLISDFQFARAAFFIVYALGSSVFML